MNLCAVENSVLDKIEEKNRLQDEYKNEVEEKQINKDVYDFCGDVDNEFDENKKRTQGKKKVATKTAKQTNTKVYLSEKDKIARNLAKEQEEILNRSKKKAQLIKQWMESHGYSTHTKRKTEEKTVKPAEVEAIKGESKEAANQEQIAITQIPQKQESLTPKDPMITVVRSKKSIEKSKTAYLDSFRKEMGGKEPSKENTQKKGLVLRRRKSTDRSGR